MNILITGSQGFIGKNLVAALENIQNSKDRTTGLTSELHLFEYDRDTDPVMLDEYCKDTDFVIHLAGITRSDHTDAFMENNFGFTSVLLQTLKRHHNTCPVMISSSIHAALDNPYGQSKKAGEELLFAYAQETGARALVYRFPNIFGKWCRPNYSSVVATFCHNIANGLPIYISDPSIQMTLVYIDNVVSELINALCGRETRDGAYCRIPAEYRVTLGEIADLIKSFKASRDERSIPNMSDPFTRKLYATYLSYLPTDGFAYPLKTHTDDRGSFTELLRTADSGQFSVNISKPGITKGNHWHHTKNEKFAVVSGTGVIRFRKPGETKIYEYMVSGGKIEVVDIPPGYTHNIENLGNTDLVTFMWASECFDPDKPDTFVLDV